MCIECVKTSIAGNIMSLAALEARIDHENFVSISAATAHRCISDALLEQFIELLAYDQAETTSTILPS